MKENDYKYVFYVSDDKISRNTAFNKIPIDFIEYQNLSSLMISDINSLFKNKKHKVYFYCLKKKNKDYRICFRIPIIYYDIDYNLSFNVLMKNRLINYYFYEKDENKEIIKCLLKERFSYNISDDYQEINNNEDLGELINKYYNFLSDIEKEKFLNSILKILRKSKLSSQKKNRVLITIRNIKRLEKKEKIKRR